MVWPSFQDPPAGRYDRWEPPEREFVEKTWLSSFGEPPLTPEDHVLGLIATKQPFARDTHSFVDHAGEIRPAPRSRIPSRIASGLGMLPIGFGGNRHGHPLCQWLGVGAVARGAAGSGAPDGPDVTASKSGSRRSASAIFVTVLNS